MIKPFVLALSLFVANAPAAAGSPTPPSLVVEPDQGLAALTDLVAGAAASIDLTMYALEDTDFEQALVDAAARGVVVRVILDQNNESSANQSAYDTLGANGVQVHWANPTFACTHQKTLTIDHAVSAVMTLNLQPQYYATSRDFALIDADPADVAAIEATFANDFTDGSTRPGNGDDLAWSPTNASATLLGLIQGAHASLRVENEEMGDAAIVSALEAAARRGVDVEVVMTRITRYARQVAALGHAGVKVALYAASAPLYIHAKVILADYGTAAARAFIGSENFSVPSLTENRELGLVTTDSGVLATLESILDGDYAGGTSQ